MPVNVGAAMKSPLIIGSDVRSLSADSLAILKNKWLIEINQGEHHTYCTILVWGILV